MWQSCITFALNCYEQHSTQLTEFKVRSNKINLVDTISTELNFTILYDLSQFSFPLDDLSNKQFTMTEPFRMQQEAFC